MSEKSSNPPNYPVYPDLEEKKPSESNAPGKKAFMDHGPEGTIFKIYNILNMQN